MVGYLYGETDIEIITASVAVENKASAHMLEKCDFIRTKDGDATVKIFSVAAYYDKEENDKVMKEAHKYVKSLKPVAA